MRTLDCIYKATDVYGKQKFKNFVEKILLEAKNRCEYNEIFEMSESVQTV